MLIYMFSHLSLQVDSRALDSCFPLLSDPATPIPTNYLFPVCFTFSQQKPYEKLSEICIHHPAPQVPTCYD